MDLEYENVVKYYNAIVSKLIHDKVILNVELDAAKEKIKELENKDDKDKEIEQ